MDTARPLKLAVIREEFVALTGDYKKALILNQFIYWQQRVRDVDNYLEEESNRLNISDDYFGAQALRNSVTEGWIYKASNVMASETMLGLSTSNMRTHIKTLVENGWLLQRDNPKHKWDKTKQYRVDLIKVSEDLKKLGYSLPGWHIPVPELAVSKTETRPHETEDQVSETEFRDADKRYAIPETTLKTTPKTTVERNETKVSSSPSPAPTPRRAKGLSEQEAQKRCLDFFGRSVHGSNVHELIRIAAEENKTRTIAWTRAYREFVSRFEANLRKYPDITEDAWEYGFERAIAKPAPNIGYVTAAAQGYTPNSRSPMGARNGHKSLAEKSAEELRREEEDF